MRQLPAPMAFVIAAAAGFGMWVGVSQATGEIEAWDSLSYFVLGLPLLATVLLALGYLAPARSWRWAVAAALAQVVAMFWLQPGSGPLVLLGLIFHGLMSFGLVLVAQAGAALSRRQHHGRAG